MTASRPASPTGPACPECHSSDVLPILYGYPSAEAFEAAARGELLIGGSSDGDHPRWGCRSCGRRFCTGDVARA